MMIGKRGLEAPRHAGSINYHNKFFLRMPGFG